jgi:hypothetical protein
MSEIPRLQVAFLKPHSLICLTTPLAACSKLGEPVKSRAVAIGEHVQSVHGLRMLQFFRFNTVVGRLVEFDLCSRDTRRATASTA